MTAKDICWLIRKKYAAPEYAVAFQVGNSTGYGTNRHLDAITMSLYPSRGLTLYGFEIKVDRQDIKREISDPDKAESIAQYLDHFFVVYPEELKVLDLEIPPGWGLISATPDGLKTVKPAEKIPSVPLTKSFVAALFRSMCIEDQFRAEKMIEQRVKELEDDFASRVKRASDLQRSEHNERLKWAESVIKTLTDAGFVWNNLRWDQEPFVRAVKSALTHRSLSIDRMKHVSEMLKSVAEDLDEEVKTLETPAEVPNDGAAESERASDSG